MTPNGNNQRHKIDAKAKAINSCGTATAVAQQRPNLVSLFYVISHCHCHIRGVCTLPGCQIPDGGKHSQFHRNYNQSGRAGNGRTQVRASRAVPRARTSLGRQQSHRCPCRRRTFRRTRRTNQMCSTNSLRLQRRHHRLPGIHRRRHSDRWAATLRGSGSVSGPVAGRA